MIAAGIIVGILVVHRNNNKKKNGKNKMIVLTSRPKANTCVVKSNMKYISCEMPDSSNLKKGEVIAKLKTRNLVASFDGVVTKRDFSNDINVSESSLLINLEDISSVYVDVDIPELYSRFIKENLNVNVKFSGNSEKIY